jgi:hypothetical protein
MYGVLEGEEISFYNRGSTKIRTLDRITNIQLVILSEVLIFIISPTVKRDLVLPPAHHTYCVVS